MENFRIKQQLKEAEQCLNALVKAIASNNIEKANELKASLLTLHKHIAQVSVQETQVNLTQMINSYTFNISFLE